jgi:hypothetical protein
MVWTLWRLEWKGREGKGREVKSSIFKLALASSLFALHLDRLLQYGKGSTSTSPDALQ